MPLVFNNVQQQSPRRPSHSQQPGATRQTTAKKSQQQGLMGSKHYSGPHLPSSHQFLREPCVTSSQVVNFSVFFNSNCMFFINGSCSYCMSARLGPDPSLGQLHLTLLEFTKDEAGTWPRACLHFTPLMSTTLLLPAELWFHAAVSVKCIT